MLLGALKVLRRADNAMRRAAKITVALPIIAIGLIGVSAPLSRATETTIEQTPAGAVRDVVGIRCGAISDNMKVSSQAARSIG